MNTVPIVFSFNHWILNESGVCISSLLRHAHSDTFYKIHILHGEGELTEEHKNRLLKLKVVYSNFSIEFFNIGDTFNNVHIARGVPKVTYYRFLIPSLLPGTDKIIFSDPDIIFKGDLYEVYSQTNLEGNYIAGVKSAFVKKTYIQSIGCDPYGYINGGFQIYNLKAFRENELDKKQLEMCGGKYFYLDQDITNIVCKDKIVFLSPKYNATQVFFKHSKLIKYKNWMTSLYSKQELEEGENPIVHHFNGVKPWNGLCYKHDVYWEEYRNSIFYDFEIYYKHYKKILDPNPKLLINLLTRSLMRRAFGKFKHKYIDKMS